MALMYPAPIESDTRSEAERFLYRSFKDQLSDDYRVFHSVRWNMREPSRQHPQANGEADFLIAHREFGILILEVKGGGIRFDNTGWYTKRRDSGKEEKLKKDPFEQAKTNLYALRDHLKNSTHTRSFIYPIYHAVAFPDCTITSDMGPSRPKRLVIDDSKLSDLESALRGIFRYWSERYTDHKAISNSALEALTNLLAPTVEISARITSKFADENMEMKQLTQTQYQLLRMLKRQSRAVIIGGAGTGKTMLAEEKMRQLAESGLCVLFLCYNTNLRKRVERDAQTIKTDGMRPIVATFLGLNNVLLGLLGKPKMHIESMSIYEDQVADILVDTVTQLRMQSPDMLFDAIIVDEGQDFRSHWWIALDDLLKHPSTGIFYVFCDDNQEIYRQVKDIPLPEGQKEPYILDVNCRNTQSIFRALSPYAVSKLHEDTTCDGPEGRLVEHFPTKDDKETMLVMQQVLDNIFIKLGVSSKDVIILTPRAREHSSWKDNLMIGKYVLSWDIDNLKEKSIRVSTIHSFKGLESPVVILTELHAVHEQRSLQLTYIGISRARNHLVIIGDLPKQ